MKIDIGTLKGRHLFDFLVANKTAIIDMKKCERKFSEVTTLPNPFMLAAQKSKAVGKVSVVYENDEAKGVLKRTIVANTYNWMDSHDDVHLDNLFANSIAQRGKRIPHLHDHIFQLDAKVGNPIGYSEQAIAWKDLGVDLEGETMALILESEILKAYNEMVYEEYLNDRIDQHSVFMNYIKLALAINDEQYKEEYATWTAVFDRIGNKDVVEKQGYFFAVSEAKLNETSAVLLGSNELTPTLGKVNTAASSTGETEPVKSILKAGDLLKHYKL